MESVATTALVLVGGMGTRLRPVVADRPKPLASVAGRPFLAYVLDQLLDAGVTDVVLCTGHRGEDVEAAFGDSYRSLRLRYSQEPERLDTAGALQHAMRLVTTNDVIVCNGDSFCAVDLAEFHEWFRRQGKPAGIVALDQEDVGRFGQLRLDSAARVTAFDEKGRARGRGWINAGIYAFETEFLRRLPCGPLSLERDVLPFLAAELSLPAFRTGARFIDIGTPESFVDAQQFFVPERAGLLVLDRDGTIIEEKHYLADPEQVELIPGVAEGLRELRDAGYDIAVVTNQSGVGRGYFDESALDAVNRRMLELLESAGVTVDAVFHCPHTPDDACSCRKPRTGMLEAASDRLGYAAHECTVVGDKACDIDLGHGLGARTVLVRTGYGSETESSGACSPDLVVDGIAELARLEAKA